MRKIVNATYMTLDGDIQNMADWHFDYFGPDAIRAAGEQLADADALIMGRKTYEGFAAAWPERADADEFSAKMNDVPHYVVSNTLENPTWKNTTVIGGDVVAQVRELKAQPGADILQFGFGSVSRLLLANGLLDELRIWLHPVLSGKAKPSDLMYHDLAQTRFTLSNTDVHGSGLVVLTYTAPTTH